MFQETISNSIIGSRKNSVLHRIHGHKDNLLTQSKQERFSLLHEVLNGGKSNSRGGSKAAKQYGSGYSSSHQ
jgi:hypothetical protein